MTDSFDFLSWVAKSILVRKGQLFSLAISCGDLPVGMWGIATDAVSVLKAPTVTQNRNCWQCHHLYKGNNCKRLPFSLAGQELVCSRIAWLFVRSVGFHHARNSLMHDNGWWLPPSGHIHRTRRNKERGIIGPPRLLDSRHWVLFLCKGSPGKMKVHLLPKSKAKC